MFIDRPHEVVAPAIQPVSRTVRVSRALVWGLVTVIIIGAGTVAWWFAYGADERNLPTATGNQNQKNSNAAVLRQNTNLPITIFTDSDEDGLYDEIERVYGTGVEKADTDGDGYSDGEEVKHGYEPLNPEKGKRMVDLSLVAVLAATVQNPVVVSSGMSDQDRLRYYLAYDGVSTSYYASDGTLVIQCANNSEAGKCIELPNHIRTDFSRTFSTGQPEDTFRTPF